MPFETISFGVGSLFLEVKNRARDIEWEKIIGETLENIPSVDDIEIKGSSFFFRRGELLDVTEEEEQVISQRLPAGGYVSFSLQIPRRTQLDLSPLFRKVTSESGKFNVKIKIGREYCTTVVAPGDPGKIDDVSHGVMIVREFLQRELAKLGDDCPVRLVALGPSPFHADFHVSSGVGATPLGSGLSVTHDKPGPIDQYEFFGDSSFQSSDSALTAVLDYIRPELECFYLNSAIKYRSRRRHSEISDDFSGILSLHQDRSPKRRAMRVIRSSGLIRDARISLLQLQTRLISEKSDGLERLSELRSMRPVTVLEDTIERSLDFRGAEDLDSFEKGLAILESRHTQTIQRITAFSVSLLGVAVGALLTAWLRK